MNNLEQKVDECFNYLVWKLIESNKNNPEKINWEEEREYYAVMDGCKWITDGVHNKKLVPSIEPMPKGFRFGFTKKVD